MGFVHARRFAAPNMPLLSSPSTVGVLSAGWLTLCTNVQGYDSIQFLPYPGLKPLGSFPGSVGLIEMVMVNLDGQYTCGTQNASATPLRAGWHAS